MLSTDPHNNWLRLQDALHSDALRPGHETVVLVDGDRTLTQEDTSRLFLDRAGLSLAPIERSRRGSLIQGSYFTLRCICRCPSRHSIWFSQEIAAAVELLRWRC